MSVILGEHGEKYEQIGYNHEADLQELNEKLHIDYTPIRKNYKEDTSLNT